MDEYILKVYDHPEDVHWNDLITSLPGVHILQTSYWAEIKKRVGWEAQYLVWEDNDRNIKAASLALIKNLPLLGRLWKTCIIYIPRGPVLDWSNTSLVTRVLQDLIEFGKRKKAIFLKIDPELPVAIGLPGSVDYKTEVTGQNILKKLSAENWKYSTDQIQFKNTIVLDISLPETEILSRMKQKTRYNISLAGRKGVSVRQGNPSDFPLLYRMYAQTALRDGFAIRDEEYYRFVWNMLYNAQMAMPMIAEVDGQPVSALVLFMFANKAYYFYGMSTSEQKDKMPNHLLQWEAIRYAKKAGCVKYDFWGAPDTFSEEDSMWGVFRFKDGFNGTIISGIGAWDFVIDPGIFKVYSELIPAMMNLMRKIGRKRVSNEVEK